MSVFDDYYARVSAGRLSGHDQYFKYGVNNSVDTSTPEDIISQGGNVQILSANATVDIVSSSSLDTSAGTGCRRVAVFGVDEDMVFTTEVITLNGTTPVVLQHQYIAIWRLVSVAAGSLRRNQGTITLATVSGDITLDQIPVKKGLSLSTLMAIPKGYTMILYDIFISLGVVTGSSVSRKGVVTARTLNYLTNAETVQAEIGVRDNYTVAENFRMPLSLSECQFLWFRADAVSTNGTPLQCSYTFELIQNPWLI